MTENQLDELLTDIVTLKRLGERLYDVDHVGIAQALRTAQIAVTTLDRKLSAEADRKKNALLRETIRLVREIGDLRYILDAIWMAGLGWECPENHSPYYGGVPCGLCKGKDVG